MLTNYRLLIMQAKANGWHPLLSIDASHCFSLAKGKPDVHMRRMNISAVSGSLRSPAAFTASPIAPAGLKSCDQPKSSGQTIALHCFASALSVKSNHIGCYLNGVCIPSQRCLWICEWLPDPKTQRTAVSVYAAIPFPAKKPTSSRVIFRAST
jgi:hypothetical protein